MDVLHLDLRPLRRAINCISTSRAKKWGGKQRLTAWEREHRELLPGAEHHLLCGEPLATCRLSLLTEQPPNIHRQICHEPIIYRSGQPQPQAQTRAGKLGVKPRLVIGTTTASASSTNGLYIQKKKKKNSEGRKKKNVREIMLALCKISSRFKCSFRLRKNVDPESEARFPFWEIERETGGQEEAGVVG